MCIQRNLQDLRCICGKIDPLHIRGRDRLAASGGSSPRPMKLCSLRPPKADVHRKGITFSSQELSQTPQNKLQAMTSHCENHQPLPPRRNMVSAPPAIKMMHFSHFIPFPAHSPVPKVPPCPGLRHIESPKKKRRKKKDKAVQSQFRVYSRS